MGFPYSVNVENLSNAGSRSGVAFCRIPIDKGVLTSTSTQLVAHNSTNRVEHVQWKPAGRLHIDGSVKYAEIAFSSTLTSLEEKQVVITTGIPDTREDYAWSNSVTTALASVRFDLLIEGNVLAISLADIANFQFYPEIPSTKDVIRKYKKFVRLQSPNFALNTPLWARVTVEIAHKTNYIKFWFRFGNSYIDVVNRRNGTYPNTNFSFTQDPYLGIIHNRPAYIREETYRTASKILDPSFTSWKLIDINYIPNGGSYANFPTGSYRGYKGVIFFDGIDSSTSACEAQDEIHAIATYWPGLNPPFGVVPGFPTLAGVPISRSTGVSQLKSRVATDRSSLQTSNPYQPAKYALSPNTAATGGQATAFSAMRGWATLRCASVAQFPMLRFDTYQSALRPNFFYYPDGTQFRALNHKHFNSTACLIWNGTPFDSNGQPNSYDLLGRSRGLTGSDVPESGRVFGTLGNGIRWYGPDREHWTYLWESLYALLSGDEIAIELMEMLAELAIATNWIDRGIGSSIPTHDTSRTVGRMMHSSCMLYEITGNANTAEIAIKDRIKMLVDGDPRDRFPWAGGMHTNPVKTIWFQTRDDRVLREHTSARFWMESIAEWGLYAGALTISGISPTYSNYANSAITMLSAAAITTVNYGFFDARTTEQYVEINSWQGGGSPIIGATLSGLTSTATGIIWKVTSNIAGRFDTHLSGCQGQFLQGEAIRQLSNDTTALISVRRDTYLPVDGYRLDFNLPTMGSILTNEQIHEVKIGTNGYPSPWGDFVNYKPSILLAAWTLPGIQLGRKFATEVGDLATVAKANDILDTIVNLGDDGTFPWNENDDANEWLATLENSVGGLMSTTNGQSTTFGNLNVTVPVSGTINGIGTSNFFLNFIYVTGLGATTNGEASAGLTLGLQTLLLYPLSATTAGSSIANFQLNFIYAVNIGAASTNGEASAGLTLTVEDSLIYSLSSTISGAATANITTLGWELPIVGSQPISGSAEGSGAATLTELQIEENLLFALSGITNGIGDISLPLNFLYLVALAGSSNGVGESVLVSLQQESIRLVLLHGTINGSGSMNGPFAILFNQIPLFSTIEGVGDIKGRNNGRGPQSGGGQRDRKDRFDEIISDRTDFDSIRPPLRSDPENMKGDVNFISTYL